MLDNQSEYLRKFLMSIFGNEQLKESWCPAMYDTLRQIETSTLKTRTYGAA